MLPTAHSHGFIGIVAQGIMLSCRCNRSGLHRPTQEPRHMLPELGGVTNVDLARGQALVSNWEQIQCIFVDVFLSPGEPASLAPFFARHCSIEAMRSFVSTTSSRAHAATSRI